MENMNFELWQTALLVVLYVAYLSWVMFGGLRKRKIKLKTYIIMTLLMIYGVIHEFTGISCYAEAINIGIILAIGFIKGIVLGKRKIIEKVDGCWYMYHDKKYIVIWIAFFVLKIILTQILKTVTAVKYPMWHMILYFAFYYPWRTINVFLNNKEMKNDILVLKNKSFVGKQ